MGFVLKDGSEDFTAVLFPILHEIHGEKIYHVLFVL